MTIAANLLSAAAAAAGPNREKERKRAAIARIATARAWAVFFRIRNAERLFNSHLSPHAPVLGPVKRMWFHYLKILPLLISKISAASWHPVFFVAVQKETCISCCTAYITGTIAGDSAAGAGRARKMTNTRG